MRINHKYKFDKIKQRNKHYQIEQKHKIEQKSRLNEIEQKHNIIIENIKINIVIFSKDRACQLDCFLKSLKKYWTSIPLKYVNILYTYSNEEYKLGYDLVKQKYPEFNFILENKFKNDLLNIINESNEYTVFFVDDNIFIQYFRPENKEFINFLIDPSITCFSLRLGSNINYNYITQSDINVPCISENGLFYWKKEKGYWGYPMSVDDHIFKTIDIFPLIKNLDYYNPNTFEAQLNSKICKNDKCFISIDNKPKMSCDKTSIIFNYPINRVQDIYKNKHAGSFHQKEINRMYLKHIEIDQKSFENILPRSPHEEVDLYFTCGVSILMPLYNGFEFIDESVGSIINQTHYNWELIIGVNGYKEDNKIYNQVLQKYSNNNKIKILNFTKTNGKSETLNEMIKYCDYEWISLLDVDDKWEPNKLERQMKYISKYDIIGSGCYYIIKNKVSGKPNICYGEINKSVFKKINPIINSSCLFMKKDAYWDPYFKVAGDYELWSRLNSQGKKFYNIKEFLVYHRLHDKSYFNTQFHTKYYQDILTLIRNKYN